MKTLTERIALAVSLCVVAAGSYVCFAHPERRWQCVLGVSLLGLAWLLRRFFGRNAEASPAALEARRSITQSIVFAGLLLGVGMVEAMGWVAASGDFRLRASQFLAGAMVAIIANAIPKKAVASPRLAAMLRANGRALFLGGLGYALAWLLLPLDYANAVALSVMLLAFAYVVVRIVFCAVGRKQSIPPAGSA